MSLSSRRERIEAMLAEEPHDKFLRYSLALELANQGDHEQSLSYLQGLMEEEPPYVPAFFMSGQQLVQIGRMPEARHVLRQGIEQAGRSGDAHAAGEMSEFLASLGLPGE